MRIEIAAKKVDVTQKARAVASTIQKMQAAKTREERDKVLADDCKRVAPKLGVKPSTYRNWVWTAAIGKLKNVGHSTSKTDAVQREAERVAAELTALRRDRAGFDRVYAKLASAATSEEQARAIAKAYTGTDRGLRSKRAALSSIKNFFNLRVQLSITADMA